MSDFFHPFDQPTFERGDPFREGLTPMHQPNPNDFDRREDYWAEMQNQDIDMQRRRNGDADAASSSDTTTSVRRRRVLNPSDNPELSPAFIERRDAIRERWRSEITYGVDVAKAAYWADWWARFDAAKRAPQAPTPPQRSLRIMPLIRMIKQRIAA